MLAGIYAANQDSVKGWDTSKQEVFGNRSFWNSSSCSKHIQQVTEGAHIVSPKILPNFNPVILSWKAHTFPSKLHIH